MATTYTIKKLSPDIVAIELNNLVSLYSPQCFDFFKALDSLLPRFGSENAPPPIKLLVLCQRMPLNDYQEEWIFHLKNSLFRQEVFSYFKQANTVLEKIHRAPITVMYLSDAECFGSFFELALACHIRLWFNKKPLIGFPEAEFGFFPNLNSLGVEKKLLNEIKSHPKLPLVFKARDAFHSGIIHKAINYTNWYESLAGLVPDWLNSGYLNKLRFSHGPNNKSPRAYKYIKEKTMWRHIPDGDDELHHLKLRAHYYDLYLENNSKNKSTETSAGDSPALALAAKQVFDPKYIKYLEFSTIKDSALTNLTHEPILAIDVTHSTLPKGSLLRLIQSKKRLFLCCLEEDDLKKSLEVLYHRLSSIIKPEKLSSYWQNYVWWGHLGEEPLKCPRLSWMAEQELKLSFNKSVFNFIHIYRDINSYRPSIYEWCCPENDMTHKEAVLQIMGCICKDVIMTRPLGKNQRSVSSVIRMAFLSDMIAFCRISQLSLEKILSALEKTGWVFASQSQQWDAFLNYHGEEFVPVDDAETKFFKEFMTENPNFFSMNRLIKELSRNASRGVTPPNNMSVHIRLLTYASLIVKKLAQLNTGLSLNQIDLLTSRALGVPLVEGTPLNFIRDSNNNRLKAYVTKNWPHLSYLC